MRQVSPSAHGVRESPPHASPSRACAGDDAVALGTAVLAALALALALVVVLVLGVEAVVAGKGGNFFDPPEPQPNAARTASVTAATARQTKRARARTFTRTCTWRCTQAASK